MFGRTYRNHFQATVGLAGRLVATGVFAGMFAAVIGTAGVACAQTARVVTASFPPLTTTASADKKGLVHDLVAEMLKLQKIDKPIEFIAWSDAVKLADSEKGIVIFPMTRTPEREAKYVWLTKVFDMNRSFAVRPGGAAVNTVDEAKALKAVGTTAASASLAYLKKSAIPNVVEFPTSAELMKALLTGAVDAAYQPVPFAKADWHAAGGTGALVFGAVQEVSAAYVAANPGSGLNPNDWQGALQVLEQEGTFDKLLHDYAMD
jgi:polar amino acid transport system substrate-binding protein